MKSLGSASNLPQRPFLLLTRDASFENIFVTPGLDSVKPSAGSVDSRLRADDMARCLLAVRGFDDAHAGTVLRSITLNSNSLNPMAAIQLLEILPAENKAGDTALTIETVRDVEPPDRMSVAHDGKHALYCLGHIGQYVRAPLPNSACVELIRRIERIRVCVAERVLVLKEAAA